LTTTGVKSDALLDAYEQQQPRLGGSPGYQRARVSAARDFLHAHSDLDAWMADPLDRRLAELRRHPLAWPLVGFALLTGRCHADVDFLFAKNFGHSMARWTALLFADDVQALHDAADRLHTPVASTRRLLREALPLAVAFAGCAPSSLTEQTLAALGEATATTTRLTGPMRRRHRAYLFGLGRLLFGAGCSASRRAPSRRRLRDAPGAAGQRARAGDPPDDRGVSGRTSSRAAAQDDRKAHQRVGDLRRVRVRADSRSCRPSPSSSATTSRRS